MKRLQLSTWLILCFTGVILAQPVKDSQIIFLEKDASRHSVQVKEKGWQSIRVCNLKVSQTYQIILNTSKKYNCNIELKSTADFVRDDRLPMITITPEESCFDFEIYTACQAPPPSAVLSVQCRDCREPERPKNMGPIQVSSNSDAHYLIQNVFIGGGCFDVTGTTRRGDQDQTGTFTSGASSINIEEGIILSSGSVFNASGPNNSPSTSTGYGNIFNDPDLLTISNGNTIYDVASIEFSFTPTIPTISFQYAFGSEEYCEFASPVFDFNDVFGFFISGPGINGPFSNNAENIAQLPGGVGPVSIQNVNHAVNAAYYNDNVPLGVSTGCNSAPGVAENDIEYDGFTNVLTAVANVIPCQTYRIKLIVADAGDGIYDSAVFLKANSFNAGDAATSSVSITDAGAAPNAPYEGCSDAFFTFERVGDDLSQPFVVPFTISPLSTATAGIDYGVLPNAVIIPPGQTSVTLFVDIFEDFIFEGIETIILELDNPCSCNADNSTIEITDPPPLDVVIDDIIACDGEEVIITPQIIGGIPGYTYQWSTGSSNPSLVVEPTGLQNFGLTVSDNCGQTAFTTFSVFGSQPTATLTGTSAICQGNFNASLQIDFTGIGPYDITYSVDGFFETISGIYSNSFNLPVSLPGTYELVAVTSLGCPGIVSGTGEVTIEEILLEVENTPINCFGQADGAIDITVSGGLAPYSFNWDQGLPDQEDVDSLSAGTYNLTVTDTNGCVNTTSATIVQPSELILEDTQIEHLDCLNPDNGNIAIEVSGGSGSYSYQWNNGANTSAIENLEAGTYQLTITDENNCQITTTAIVENNVLYPEAVVQPPDTLNCSTSTVSLDATPSSSGAFFTYEWTRPDGTTLAGSNNLSLTADSPGIYQFAVTNNNNYCVSSTSIEVLEDQIPPFAEAGIQDTLTCYAPSLTLDGSASSQGPFISYQWSSPDGNAITSNQSLFPQVDQAGQYILKVINNQNNCFSNDTVTIAVDQNAPQIALSSPGVLNCYTPEIEISSQGSDTGDHFVYSWTTTDGQIISATDAESIMVDALGTYELNITNQENGCRTTENLSIAENFTPPVADAGLDQELDCITSSTTLDGSNSSNNGNYQYNWTSETGNIIGENNTLTATVDAPGLYIFQVLDLENGCVDSATVLVSENSDAPVIALAVEGILNCAVTEILLDGSGSDSGSNFALEWNSLENNPIQNADQLQATVSAPGTYILSITDQNSGCISSSSLVVTQDILPPHAEAGPGFHLTCSNPEFTLDGTNSDQGGPFTLEWTVSDGTILSAPNAIQQTIQTAGTYFLDIVNTENGCSSRDSVEITADQVYPIAETGPDLRLTCDAPAQIIEAGASSLGPSFSVSWNTLDGNTQIPGGDLAPIVQNAGVFELVITNTENGCTTQDTVVVEEDLGIPEAQIISPPILTCVDTILTLDASNSSQGDIFQYQWYTGNGHILQGENGLTPLVDTPGLYELEILNTSNQCSISAIISVFQDIEQPIADAGPSFTLTCTDPILNLNGTNSSLGTPFLYTWEADAGQPISAPETLSPTINEPGTYRLSVLNTQNGCHAADQVSIFSDQIHPVVDIGPDAELNCAQTSHQIQANISETGGDFTSQWNTLEGTLDIPPSDLSPTLEESGIFELVILNNQNGCRTSDTLHLTENFSMPYADAGVPALLNCVDTTLFLDGTASTQGEHYRFSWHSDEGHFLSPTNTPSPQIDAPGLYILTVSHSESFCQDSATVLITQDITLPLASIASPDTLTCATGAVYLDGSNSSTGDLFTYTWHTETGHIIGDPNEINVTVDLPGPYQLEVTNQANGCTTTAPIQVLENRIFPIAEAGPDGRLTCLTHTVNLDGTQSTTGNHIVYQWNRLEEQPIEVAEQMVATVDAPGSFELRVLDVNNLCASFDTATVSIDTIAPIAHAGPRDTLTCVAPTLTLNGSQSSTGSDIEYEWTASDNQPIQNAQSLMPQIEIPGIYQIQVRNTDNGCSATDEVGIAIDTLHPILQILEPDMLTCAQTSIPLMASATADQPMSFSWTTSNGLILGGQGSLSPIIADAGLYQLLAINQGNGCITTASTEVAIDTISPIAEAGFAPNLNCTTSSIQLNGGASSQGAFSYQWTGPANAILNGAASLFPTINSPGWYTLLVENLENGCTQEDQVEVILNDVLPVGGIIPPEELNCERPSITLQGFSDESDMPYDYHWKDEMGNILGLDSPLSIDVNQPGVYGFFILNLENQCRDSIFVEVSQDVNIPIADAGNLAILNCIETTAELDGSQSSTGSQMVYEWSTNDGQILSGGNGLHPIVNAEGTYTLLVKNLGNGCSNEDQVLVREEVPETATIEKIDPLCYGDFGRLEISNVVGGYGPYIFSLDNGAHFSTQTYYDAVEPGVYDIVVQDINGCNYEETIEIIEPILLDIHLEANIAIRLGDIYQLDAQVNIPESEIQHIQWSPERGLSCTDCLDPEASPHETTNYELKVVNTNGCQDIAKLNLLVDKRSPIYVPNAFSPYNEDDINDRFVIYAKEDAILKINSLIIFNRWGEMVFQVYDFPPNDPRYGWNGLHRGEKMNPGVFVYWTEVELIDGSKILLKGDVTLME